MTLLTFAQTTLEPRDWINLAIQLPVVGLFAWFVLRLSSEYKRDMKEQMAAFVAFVDAQNERVDRQATAEAERRREAMKLGLDELRHVSGVVKESLESVHKSVEFNRQSLTEHRAEVKARWEALAQRFLGEKQPT